MFVTNAEHNKFITDCVAASPDHIIISTFGLWAGLLYDGRDTREWGKKYHSDTREQLELMRAVPNVQILVGIADYFTCDLNKAPCLSCEVKYIRGLFRLAAHIDAFPEFHWRISNNLHMKCALFFYGDKSVKGVAGGRNFSDSEWADITFEMTKPQITALTKAFIDNWRKARPMTDTVIGEIIESQNISTKAMETIINTQESIIEDL